MKRLLKNIANSSSKCCEAVKNAISNLKFQTKDEHKALVRDFEGFSKNAKEIFKKLDKKFKDFYHLGIKVEIKDISDKIPENENDPGVYFKRNHDLWKTREIHLRNTTLAALYYFINGVNYAVKMLKELVIESGASGESTIDLTFMYQQLVATRCAFLLESIRTAFCDLDFFQQELAASSKKVKTHKLHSLVELFMKSTEQDLDEDSDVDEDTDDETDFPDKKKPPKTDFSDKKKPPKTDFPDKEKPPRPLEQQPPET